MCSPILSTIAVAAFAFGAFTTSQASAQGETPLGVWINDTGKGAVEITQCGEGLCGRVVWVKEKSKVKKVCGLQVIGDAAPVGGGIYDKGWIYDPEERHEVRRRADAARRQAAGHGLHGRRQDAVEDHDVDTRSERSGALQGLRNVGWVRR